MELPQYTLYLSKPRILLPKSLILIFLGGFLYFGAWLNLLILNIIIPSEYHLYIVIAVVVLVAMQALINYIKFSNYRYLFYGDRLIFEGKKEKVIAYSSIQNMELNSDFIDNLFGTGTINLAPVHKMKYISNTNQVYFYLQKLIQNAQATMPQQPYGYQRTQEYYQRQV